MGSYSNPVLPGSHPDPSVCRVGSDYYLVTSSFEYFPGLPIHHSRDLVNWRLVTNAISRPGQVDLDSVASSDGLYAPTLRSFDGTFFLLCTLVSGPGRTRHFVVTASAAAGRWSDPAWLEGDGFDPSLFFDDDGTAWFHATRLVAEPEHEGQTEVWLRRFDVANRTLTGDEHVLWRGALRGAIWAEGPHLYRIGGRYVLLAAEGGTSIDHAVVVATADTVTGPYTGIAANPVLTHRDLGTRTDVVNVGHADLVDSPDGRWWAVLLATRLVDGRESLLGRETHLVPVEWEDGRPLFAPGHARVLPVFFGEGIPSAQPAEAVIVDDFDADALGPEWSLVRSAPRPRFSLTARPGFLRLLAGSGEVFVGCRVEHLAAELVVDVDVESLTPGSTAGVMIRRTDDARLQLLIETDADGSRELVGRVEAPASDAVDRRWPLPQGTSALGIRLNGFAADLIVVAEATENVLARLDATPLADPAPNTFVGIRGGAVATSGILDVDATRYRPLTSGRHENLRETPER